MSVDSSILEDGLCRGDRQPEIVSVVESGVPVRVQEWAEMPRDQRRHTHQRAYLNPMEDNHMQDEVTIQGSKREQGSDEGNQQGVGRIQCESGFALVCGFREVFFSVVSFEDVVSLEPEEQQPMESMAPPGSAGLRSYCLHHLLFR